MATSVFLFLTYHHSTRVQWVEHSVRPSVGRRIQPERSMGQDEFPLCGNGQAGMPILLKAWIPAFAGTTSIRQT
ncbi:MAG: hypothetical protein HN757_13575 [Calditrichaeota bacterium]|nr:hypothetical protein [Calditrichota bacterium]